MPIWSKPFICFVMLNDIWIAESINLLLFNAIQSSSSTANGTEFKVSGVVILVTLTSNNNADVKGLPSSFALSFLKYLTSSVPGRVLYPSTFVMGEGPMVASFPENNTVNYENNADHFMLIARPSGRPFNLTRIFYDTEADKDIIQRWYIDDVVEKTRLVYMWS